MNLRQLLAVDLKVQRGVTLMLDQENLPRLVHFLARLVVVNRFILQRLLLRLGLGIALISCQMKDAEVQKAQSAHFSLKILLRVIILRH